LQIIHKLAMVPILASPAHRKYFQIQDGKGFLEMEKANISCLAFGFRSWRKVDLRVCLSGASYAAAEKAERRMALKI